VKYLQLFNGPLHPWTKENRKLFILWSEDGEVEQYGHTHTPELQTDEKIVRLKPVMKIKLIDFDRTVGTKTPAK
jgi:hypothetical protein